METKKFMKKYAPEKTSEYVQSWLLRMYIGTAPKLAEVNQMYGEIIARRWVSMHLLQIFSFMAVENRVSKKVFNNLVSTILSAYPNMRVTEFMLFCHYFCTGKYPKLYCRQDGCIDCTGITSALLEFWNGRNDAVYALQRAERRETPQPPQQPTARTERIDPAVLDQMIADFMKELNLGSKRTANVC